MDNSLSLGKGHSILWPLCKPLLVFLLLASPLLFSLAGTGVETLRAPWLRDWFQGQGLSGVFRYTLAVAALSVCGAPRQALAAFGGYLLGETDGCLFTTLGLLLGAACSFYPARLLLADTVRKRFGPRLLVLDRTVSGNPFSAILMLRLFPVGNNALLNLSAGVSHIPPGSFFAATAVGYLPQNLVFSLLGSGVFLESTVMLGVSGTLFLLSSVLGWHVLRRHRRAMEQ